MGRCLQCLGSKGSFCYWRPSRRYWGGRVNSGWRNVVLLRKIWLGMWQCQHVWGMCEPTSRQFLGLISCRLSSPTDPSVKYLTRHIQTSTLPFEEEETTSELSLDLTSWHFLKVISGLVHKHTFTVMRQRLPWTMPCTGWTSMRHPTPLDKLSLLMPTSSHSVPGQWVLISNMASR